MNMHNRDIQLDKTSIYIIDIFQLLRAHSISSQ